MSDIPNSPKASLKILQLVNRFSNKTKKNTLQDREMGEVNNNRNPIERLPATEENSFEQAFLNLNDQFQTSVKTLNANNTLELKKFMAALNNAPSKNERFNQLLDNFMCDLLSNITPLKFELADYKEENYSFHKLNITCGANKLLSILYPNNYKQLDLVNTITTITSKLEKNQSTTSVKFLFVLPLESTPVVIEMGSYANASKSGNKITIYIPNGLAKKELLNLKNMNPLYFFSKTFGKISGKYKFAENNSCAVYCIKNSIIDFMKTCLLPNNASPELLEGLLAIFMHKLKENSDISVELKKISSTEKIEVPKFVKKHICPENSKEIDENIDLNIETLANTLSRTRNNSIATGTSASKDNKVLSIFKPIVLNNSSSSNLSTIEFIKHFLSQRQKDILESNSLDTEHLSSVADKKEVIEMMRDLLPLANEKGIAVIEIVTTKDSSKASVLIHDPLQILKESKANIEAIASEKNSQCKYNPRGDYSSDWKSAERCQLAVYEFIKKATLLHLEGSNQSKFESINHDTRFFAEILAEVIQNLGLNEEFKIDSLPKIKRCDGGMCNTPNFILDLIKNINALNIAEASALNESNSNQTSTVEIPDQVTKVCSADGRSSLFKPTTKSESSSPTVAPVPLNHSMQIHR